MSTPAELLALMPFAAGIGIVVDSAAPGETVGHLDWAAERCTAGGLLHGGALLSLADTVGAVCAYLNLPKGAGTATTNTSTALFRAVREGTVTATARPVHIGRTLIVVRVSLVDSLGRAVGETTQTQAVLAPAAGR